MQYVACFYTHRKCITELVKIIYFDWGCGNRDLVKADSH